MPHPIDRTASLPPHAPLRCNARSDTRPDQSSIELDSHDQPNPRMRGPARGRCAICTPRGGGLNPNLLPRRVRDASSQHSDAKAGPGGVRLRRPGLRVGLGVTNPSFCWARAGRAGGGSAPRRCPRLPGSGGGPARSSAGAGLGVTCNCALTVRKTPVRDGWIVGVPMRDATDTHDARSVGHQVALGSPPTPGCALFVGGERQGQLTRGRSRACRRGTRCGPAATARRTRCGTCACRGGCTRARPRKSRTGR